jgi:KaiC/GvpD/RAD55 family RecA-like ATPase
MKIGELINFEEIKDVIDIDSDVETLNKKKDIVNSYIISKGLKKSIELIIKSISKPKHKSTLVIGGYGSGKSHLLAWIVSILENPELADYIQYEDVKQSFKDLNRDFAVVQFELQPVAAPLSDFFFDRLEEQLEDKYNISLPERSDDKLEDFKVYINGIVNKVKEKDPKMGLVVIIDEISDFLKQKTRNEITRDIQFLRILGQVSQNTDFMFIGSMQENVFTNHKYIDEAEDFGRVSERFDIVTISKEDIKAVLSKRILNKSTEQYHEIDSLLDEYKKVFPPINADPDSYIEIFPIHPYVIKIFDELPYFEKRGVIQYTMETVGKILDHDFPEFVTYDTIFDEINAKHTVRNLDEVRPVVDVIETLDSKIDLLNEDEQENARKLVKALAVLNLYGKTTDNGATPEELANTLLITSKTIENKDKIEIILNRLRDVTSGQFINKTDKNYYYISLESGPDYDLVVERKKKNLPEGIEDEELLKLLKYTDLIGLEDAESYTRVFKDTCNWVDQKSFRLGNFIFDDGSDQVKKGDMDFNLVIKSPYLPKPSINSSKNTTIIPLTFDDDFDDLIRSLAATRLLISENYSKSVMKKKHEVFKNKAKELLLKILLESDVEVDGEKKKIKTVLTREPDNLDEFFHNIKEKLFNDYFNQKYPKYPKFLNQMSYENIKGEVDSAVKELTGKSESTFFSNAKNLLSSLDLVDLNGNIDTSNSDYYKQIYNELEANKGKNVSVDSLVEKLQSPPFGLDTPIIYLILVVATYNGEINLIKKGGGTITSSDLVDVFRSGVRAFESIPYATLETEFNPEPIIKLFQVLNLNEGLVRNSKDRVRAVQDFKNKSLEIQSLIKSVKLDIDEIVGKADSIIKREELESILEEVKAIPFGEFLKVNTVNDFRKVTYSSEEIQNIKDKLELLNDLKGFLDDYNKFFLKEYNYLRESWKWMADYPEFFTQTDIDSLKEFYDNITSGIELSSLLNSERRRILKGQLQQYKIKYMRLYYVKHTKTIGESVNWDKLENISKGKAMRRLRDMKAIKGVNSLKLNKIEDRILSLSKAKCDNLIEDHLKDTWMCTWCRFPETLKNVQDINSEIEDIEQTVDEISKEWDENIIDDIQNYIDNLKLLADTEKEIIENIVSETRLPDEISQDVITALNNLFREIEVVKVSPGDIVNFVFKNASVLDYESFSKMLEEYKEQVILKNHNKQNVRIQRQEE